MGKPPSLSFARFLRADIPPSSSMASPKRSRRNTAQDPAHEPAWGPLSGDGVDELKALHSLAGENAGWRDNPV